ncbi:MAG: hypothetical protein ACPLGZ_02970, partial [Candidatus Pelagibacter ubique]
MNKQNFLNLFLVSFLVGLFSLTLSYYKAGLYLIYFIAGVLLLLFFSRKLSLVYYALLILTLNMSEYSKYISTQNFYTFRTVEVFGVTLVTIFIIILIVYKLLFSKNKFKALGRPMFKWGLFIFFMALCIGAVHLFFGDTPLVGFRSDLYYFVVLFGSFYLAYDFANIEIVKEILLIAILISPLVILFSWIFLSLGSYGGAPISSFDPLGIVIPLIPSFLLLYRKQAQSKVPLWLVVISNVCSIVTIILQPSGKALIFLPAAIILVWLFQIKRYSMRKYVLIGSTIVLIILVSIPILPNVTGSYGNILLK